MRTSRKSIPIRFAILLFALSLSCRQTPTEPTVERSRTPAPPTPTPSNPVLIGAWTGAIKFGKDYPKPCSPSEGVVVSLAQSASKVTSTFRTNCEGMLRLQGTLSGSYLVVELRKEDGTSIGTLQGSVSSTRIYIDNNPDPWDYDVPTISLELQR